jgi:hypothetical protein
MRKLVRSLLAVVSLPLSAEELAYTITGTAIPMTGPPVTAPFSLSFTLDTLSGTQSSMFGSGGCMQTFAASSLAISAYTASVGGKTVGNVANTLGGVTATNISGTNGTCGSMELSVDVVGPPTFVWDLGAGPTPTQTHFTTSPDPLADILASFPGQGVDGELGDTWNLEPQSVDVRVPEPGILDLVVTGFFGAAIASLVARGPRRNWGYSRLFSMIATETQ